VIEGTFPVAGAAGPIAFFSHLRRETLSHAYLFSGPAGVGKKTFAVRLAQSLLCVTPKAGLLGYCGTCSGCTRVAAGTHPDLYAVEGQIKIGKADEHRGFDDDDEDKQGGARDVVRLLSMHSYAGGKRVFIFGDADFTREAANALLKFFEEPPDDVLLILTSSAPGRLLPTIRSRLVEVAFPRLTEAEIAAALVAGGTEAGEAQRAARLAGGSLTTALAALDPDAGAVRDAAADWFFAAVDGGEIDSSWATRAGLDDGLTTIKSLTRDWLALVVAGDAAPLLTPDRAADLRALPPRDPASLVKSLVAIGDAERIARSNVTPALVADLVRMSLAPIAQPR
jgi:DNA polymerase-3 subunit delta'